MSQLRRAAVMALLAFSVVSIGGCKNRRNNKATTLADLSPPKGAPAWESRFGVAFDDSYTPTAVNLQGRAPNDVLDQQLFQARLGHAALVVLVEVEQVWGQGRYQGRQDQYLELQVGEVLLGVLPKNTPERLMIEVRSTDDLPGALKGQSMLLFLRWDAETEPPYHHHLMQADDELVALIQAMVNHAQAEGVLDENGDETKSGKRRKRRGGKGKRKGDQKNGAADSGAATSDGASLPASDDPGAETTAPGGNQGPDAPPPPTGPEPDASTGLDQLEDESASPTSKPEQDLPPSRG